MAKKTVDKKAEYLTKRILFRQSNKAMNEAAEGAMELVGYVVVAEDGWVVKKHINGNVERIKQLETVEQPEKIILD